MIYVLHSYLQTSSYVIQHSANRLRHLVNFLIINIINLCTRFWLLPVKSMVSAPTKSTIFLKNQNDMHVLGPQRVERARTSSIMRLEKPSSLGQLLSVALQLHHSVSVLYRCLMCLLLKYNFVLISQIVSSYKVLPSALKIHQSVIFLLCLIHSIDLMLQNDINFNISSDRGMLGFG